MIIIAHGAFDTKDDRENGVSVLADKIRALGVSNHIHEINVDEWPFMPPVELLAEPNIYIGYSNGGQQVWDIYNSILEDTEDSEVTSVIGHIIFLDFVYKGVRQIYDRAPDQLPDSIKSALCFYRTEKDGLVPPYHNLIAKEDGSTFQNIPVEADHGQLPADAGLQDSVCQRVLEVFH